MVVHPSQRILRKGPRIPLTAMCSNGRCPDDAPSYLRVISESSPRPSTTPTYVHLHPSLQALTPRCHHAPHHTAITPHTTLIQSSVGCRKAWQGDGHKIIATFHGGAKSPPFLVVRKAQLAAQQCSRAESRGSLKQPRSNSKLRGSLCTSASRQVTAGHGRCVTSLFVTLVRIPGAVVSSAGERE